jgi:hypothetical protein
MTEAATQVAPDMLAAYAEAAWLKAWASLSRKAQQANRATVAIVEMTEAGPRALYSLHNIGGTGVAVAERRAAAIAAKTGKVVEVRVSAGDKA